MIEALSIVAVAGLAASALRYMNTRASGQTVGELDLEDRVTDLPLGVRDGGSLDVWIPANTPVPSRVVRLLRGRPEPGRGLRLSLYAGARDEPSNPKTRLVRTWLGPYPDMREPVLVEVALSVGRFGRLRVHATDKATGRTLTILRDERKAAPETTITTRQAATRDE